MIANDAPQPTDVQQAIAAAATWRAAQPENRRDAGIALVYQGAVYGWKDTLRDPQHEKPGVIAVAVDGQAWFGSGGDDYNGAAEWRPATV